MEMFDNLQPILKTFWLIALPSSLIFLLQTILTFFGSDASDGIDSDFDGDLGEADAPFQLFSFRNLINFLLGFSWAGISFYPIVSNKNLLILLSFVVGSLFVYLFFLLINQIKALAEDNSFRFEKTLNKTAEVYLAIPEKKNGKGKILISINGSYHELDAMTEKNSIPSGSMVKVLKIKNKILLVEEI